MATAGGPNLVDDGLVLALDAANIKSYSGIGTTWTDISGNGNNGTLTNGPTFDSGNGGILEFDGTNDYVGIGSVPGDFTKFTVVVWFYPTSVSNYENVIDCNYSYNSNTGNIGPRLEMYSTGMLRWIYSNNTDSNSSYFSNTVISSGLLANKWYCSTISFNGTHSSSYLNGILKNISSNTTGFINSFTNVNLGRGFHLGSSDRVFTGKIAKVQIYNRVLTSQEVLQNYNSTKGRFGL